MGRETSEIEREIYLAEYKQLKDEQRARIGVRDNLIYATFTALAAVAVFAFGGVSPRYPALLLLPPACIVLGWTYLSNDRKVSDIGKYIRTELTARLSVNADMATGLLGWEVGHRIDSRRRRRKTIQAIIDIITFCLTGGVSVVAYWIAAPTISPLLTAVSCVELVGLFLLGIEIIRYAEISPDR